MADSFGVLLRRFRVAASLTQEALAERCHISAATVAAIEQGRRNAPRLSTVRLIAGALNLSAADLESLAKAADVRSPAASEALGDSAGVPAGPAAAGPVTGLQPSLTSFIGREREQAAVLAALADHRLVSLVGPGGVGKTRLAGKVAEAAAARHRGGAVFADLVPVREGFVAQAVASVLGVTERPGWSLDAALIEHFSAGACLLILDNCEHLLEVVAALVEKLLANCAELTVLTTSRERLAIPGERVVAVSPLSLDASHIGGPAASEAEALFTERARAHDPGFTAPTSLVREVCARLDGVPLAIELAAARCASLDVDGLLAGLGDHLNLLSGSRSAHERHRSLRAVIDWSHDLLDTSERVVFRRVGAFIGGFDLNAAMAVAGQDNRSTVAHLVGRLTDKTLLVHQRGPDGSRWQMLETIRAYALDQLAGSGEEARVRDAHLSWAASVADGLVRELGTTARWRAAFDTVADDLRAALARPPGPGTAAVSHRLARALGRLAYARRFMGESREHYRTAATRAPDPGQAAADLRSAADVAMAEGHGDSAFALLLAAAEQAKAIGDDSARAAALAYAVIIADRFAAEFSAEVAQEQLREILGEATRACPVRDKYGTAYLTAAAAWIAQPEKTVADEARAREALAAARLTEDPVLITGALDAVVGALNAAGRLREAHQVNSERAALLEHLPRHDPRAAAEIIDTFHMVTQVAVAAGDLPAALAAARIAQSDDIADGQLHRTASKAVLPLVLQGRFEEAGKHAAVMWDSWERAGRPAARWMGPATYGMVLAHGLRGDGDGRRTWLARVTELTGAGPKASQVAGTNLAAFAAFTDARIAMHEGRIGAAVAALDMLPREALWYGKPQWHSLRLYAWAIAAEVSVIAGLPGAAGHLSAAAPAGAENLWAAACLARAAGRLHGDRAALEASLAGWDRIGARYERACTLLLLPDRAGEGLAELNALGCQPPVLQEAQR